MKILTLSKLYTYKDKVFTKLRLEEPLEFLIKSGLTPNKLTLINIIIGLISVLFLFKSSLIFACLFVTNRLLDILDGYMARKFNLKSDLGDKLDHWGDLALIIALLSKTIFFSEWYILSLIALFTYIAEYLLLKKQKLLDKKFPSGIFVYFFIFGIYQIGLIYQVFYQIISYAYFQVHLKKRL